MKLQEMPSPGSQHCPEMIPAWEHLCLQDFAAQEMQRPRLLLLHQCPAVKEVLQLGGDELLSELSISPERSLWEQEGMEERPGREKPAQSSEDRKAAFPALRNPPGLCWKLLGTGWSWSVCAWRDRTDRAGEDMGKEMDSTCREFCCLCSGYRRDLASARP